MTYFIPSQAIIVIVGLNHTLQVCVLFWVKRGAETSSRRRPPVLSNTDQMQPDPIEVHGGTRCQLPGLLQATTSSRLTPRCTHGQALDHMGCDMFALWCGSPGSPLPESPHALR